MKYDSGCKLISHVSIFIVFEEEPMKKLRCLSCKNVCAENAAMPKIVRFTLLNAQFDPIHLVRSRKNLRLLFIWKLRYIQRIILFMSYVLNHSTQFPIHRHLVCKVINQKNMQYNYNIIKVLEWPSPTYANAIFNKTILFAQNVLWNRLKANIIHTFMRILKFFASLAIRLLNCLIVLQLIPLIISWYNDLIF